MASVCEDATINVLDKVDGIPGEPCQDCPPGPQGEPGPPGLIGPPSCYSYMMEGGGVVSCLGCLLDYEPVIYGGGSIDYSAGYQLFHKYQVASRRGARPDVYDFSSLPSWINVNHKYGIMTGSTSTIQQEYIAYPVRVTDALGDFEDAEYRVRAIGPPSRQTRPSAPRGFQNVFYVLPGTTHTITFPPFVLHPAGFTLYTPQLRLSLIHI